MSNRKGKLPDNETGRVRKELFTFRGPFQFVVSAYECKQIKRNEKAVNLKHFKNEEQNINFSEIS